MRNKNRQSGFTLIELLVIIAIIAFLVASIMLYLAQTRQKGRNTKRVADVKQISAALDLFITTCGAYPIETTAIALDSTKNLFTSTTTNCGTRSGSSNVNGGIGDLPLSFALNSNNNVLVGEFKTAPLPADGTCTDSLGAPNGNRYGYTSNATGSSYSLTFCLGASTGGYPAGFNTITR